MNTGPKTSPTAGSGGASLLPGVDDFLLADALVFGAPPAPVQAPEPTPEPAAVDGLPVLTVADAREIESSSAIRFDVSLSASSSSDVTFFARTVSATADMATDLFRTVFSEFTIPAGQTSLAIQPSLRSDSATEGDEVFLLEIVNLAGAVLPDGGLTARANGIITDNDGENRPALFVGDAQIVEGNAGTRDAVFDVVLTRAIATPVTIPWRTLQDSATGGEDFTPRGGAITFAPGETLKQVVVPVLGDTAIEPTERFKLVLDTAGFDFAGGARSAVGTATILDDDSGGGSLPVLSIADLREVESSSAVRFAVTLSAPSSSDVTFDVRTLDGSADLSADVFRTVSGTVTIPAGQTTVYLSPSLRSDSTTEGDENFFVEIGNLRGAVLPAGALVTRAQAVILDDDGENRPALLVGDSVVVEGNAGLRTVHTDVTLSRPLDTVVDVNWTTAPLGTAGNADIVGRSGTLRFLPGETEKTVAFDVRGDTAIEPSEQIAVVLSAPRGAAFSDGGGGAVGRVTILDDDASGGLRPVLSISDSSVQEASVVSPFFVTLSAPSSSDVTFTAATLGNTADLPTDIFRSVSGAFTIPAGQTSLVIGPSLRNDTLQEGPETYFIDLTNLTGADFAGGGNTLRATGTIRDDDTTIANLTPLQVADIRVVEPLTGTAEATFTIRSPIPAGLTIAGDWEVVAGTAGAGGDFTPASGRFTIASGATQTTVTVPVLADTIPEGLETIVLRLSNIVNAGTGNSSGEIHAIGIVDDPGLASDDAVRALRTATRPIDVLANDRGGVGTLEITAVSDPSSGFVKVVGDRLLYRPDRGFTGEDSFQYTVTDGAGAQDTATVRVTVEAPPPSGGLAVGQAQTVAYLYEAGLNRDGNIDRGGLNFWIDAREAGLTLRQLGNAFLESPEFANAFGAPASLSDPDLIAVLYRNVLNREGEPGGVTFWTAVLEQPNFTRSDMLLAFAESPENIGGSPGIADLVQVSPGVWDFA